MGNKLSRRRTTDQTDDSKTTKDDSESTETSVPKTPGTDNSPKNGDDVVLEQPESKT